MSVGSQVLANAVVNITANTLGLKSGLGMALYDVQSTLGKVNAAVLVIGHSFVTLARNIVRNAEDAGLPLSRLQGILVGLSGTIGIVAIAASVLTGAFAGLAASGAQLEAAGHNIEQVFGSNSRAIEAAAERQAAAFGQSKSEYLGYAAQVGRSLEMLGVGENVAAKQTTDLLDAVQRLAQSRRISFGEAFQATQAKGALFTEEQVKGMAVQMGLLTNRNQILDAGTEALVRNQLAIQTIEATTEASARSGSNWNAQIIALQGNLANLASSIGTVVMPVFVKFLEWINDKLQLMLAAWEAFRGLLVSIGLVAAPEAPSAPGKPPTTKETELAGIDQRNATQAALAQKQRQIGTLMGGGGGSSAGFQGGLVEFARRIQSAAFSQRQLKLMQDQLKAAQDAAANGKLMVEIMQGNGIKVQVNAGNQAPWF